MLPLPLLGENKRTENQCIKLESTNLGHNFHVSYERGGDARRLPYGCKFRIFVSLRVIWAKRHHI